MSDLTLNARATNEFVDTRVLLQGQRQAVNRTGTVGFLGIAIALSDDGAVIRTYESLCPNEVIEFELQLVQGTAKVEAVVTHSQEDPVGAFHVRTRFRSISDPGLAFLREHLRELRQPAAPNETP